MGGERKGFLRKLWDKTVFSKYVDTQELLVDPKFVFMEEAPQEEWLNLIAGRDRETKQALLKITQSALDRTPAERIEHIEYIRKKKVTATGENAEERAKKAKAVGQLVVNIYAMSESNMKNFKYALEDMLRDED